MFEFIQTYLNVILVEKDLGNFICVLARTSSFLIVVPIFSSNLVPAPLKIFLFTLISFLMTSNVGMVFQGNLVMEVSFHVLVGLILGFMTRFLYDGILLGVELSGTQMGLGFANLINPMSGEHSNPLSQIYGIAMVVLFLAINGHYILLMGLAKSFHQVNAEMILNADSMLEIISTLMQKIFFIALRVALPMITTILFMQVGMALIQRSAPQMNAFALSLTLNVMVAFAIIFLGNREIMDLSLHWHEDISEVFTEFLKDGP